MTTFDEQGLYDFIVKQLKAEFKKAEWKTLFGGKTMKFVEDNFGETTSFPVIYVEISDSSRAYGTEDSSNEDLYTYYTFKIECYNQSVGDLTKVQLGRMINSKVIEILRRDLNPNITQNQQLPSPDDTIYRRLVQGSGTIDNKTKIFYR